MRPTNFQKILWAFTCVALLLFIWLQFSNNQPIREANGEPESAFQANFELVDHNGRVRTQADFSGRWMLIFFGFVNCPDICPTTLAEIAAIMNVLGSEADKVQPIFITIDPERDTSAVLASFLPNFDYRIVGLTGEPEQIRQLKEVFPIFVERTEDAAAPGGYTMGHTSHLLLFDTEARFAASWPYGTLAEEITAELKKRISLL